MWTIVFLDRETLPPEIVLRPPGFPHRWVDYDRTAPAEIVERAASADIIVVNKVRLIAATLARLPRLRLVAVAATGTDNVDLTYCRANGIRVANVRGYAATSVPEHTFALILALRRSLIAFNDAVRAGRWQEAGQFCFFAGPIADLAGSRLGIVGAGTLGRAVAELGRAFGMTSLFAGRKGVDHPPAGYTPWAEVLDTCDVLSLHCPLTPETRNLIALPEFRAMRRRPLLINTARGGIVNEADLVAALDQGLIAGAGFDVLSEEPPPPDHPLLSLAGRPNFLLTPHVAWASRQAMQTVAERIIDNIEAFVAAAARTPQPLGPEATEHGAGEEGAGEDG
jgi:glycerate dehydrogenase